MEGFNNKLNIEDTYSEINPNPNGGRYIKVNGSEYAIPNLLKKSSSKWAQSSEGCSNIPEYSVVDLSKKYQERLKKVKQKDSSEDDDEKKISNLINNLNIYEDIEIISAKNKSSKNDESNIYELVRAK